MTVQRLINIDIKYLAELYGSGLSLDHLFILQQIDLGDTIPENIRIASLVQTLVRKGYLTEDNKISALGKLTLSGAKSGNTISFREGKEDLFEEWWESFPKTTGWQEGKRIFIGDRSLRIKKKICREKYMRILEEGFEHKDLMQALEYEVTAKKGLSLSDGTNRMQYMKSTEAYLNAKVFEAFIGLGTTETKKVGGTVDF